MDKNSYDIAKCYMVTIAKFVVFGIGAPAFGLALIDWLGLKINYTEVEVIDLLSPWAPYIFALVCLVAGFVTTMRLVSDQKRKAREDFYSVDSSARIDRAFRIFSNLLREGKQAQNATPAQRQEIDRKIIKAIRDHCTASYLSVYLINTGRSNLGTTAVDIGEDQFVNALEIIERELRSNLTDALRW